MKNLFPLIEHLFPLFLIAFIITAFVYSCGENEKKEISKSDSLSLAMDSARANDTLLQRLQKDTNNQKQTQ